MTRILGEHVPRRLRVSADGHATLTSMGMPHPFGPAIVVRRPCEGVTTSGDGASMAITIVLSGP